MTDQATRDADTELLGLAQYLELIALRETTFATLNHKHWEEYVARHSSG